jgi:RNA polymerase sigma factor (sigma-70 family)
MTSATPRTRARSSERKLVRTIRLAAAGQDRAWDGLVEEFGPMVWAIARAHRLNDADAGDVFQSTWMKLLERLNQIRDPARIGAWLATTARRECLQVLRASRRQGPWGDKLPESESQDMTAEDALVLAARDEALWHGFSRLRPSDQSLLRLLVADPPMTYEEIAASLDMPIGSIGPTRARALERLRHELELGGELSLIDE